MNLTHYTYLLVDIGCFIIPFIFSYHPKIEFYKDVRFLRVPNLLTALLFLAWDTLFTRMGIWGFNGKYLTGVYILNLPIEEILFFFLIPYSCVFIYFCFQSFVKTSAPKNAFYLSMKLFALCLFLVGAINFGRYYTSVTFILLAAILFLPAQLKVVYLKPFMISFGIILVPFFISNGLLTGSFIAEPVVHYNNAYNLGIRLFTIPAEDVFYAMLLLILNVSGYEYLKARRNQKSGNNQFFIRLPTKFP